MPDDNDNDIGDLLKNIPSSDYPRDLYTATRGEFTTNVRKYRPPSEKKGCPLFILTFLFKLVVIIGLTQLIS